MKTTILLLASSLLLSPLLQANNFIEAQCAIKLGDALLSSPVVTTPDGKAATVELTREEKDLSGNSIKLGTTVHYKVSILPGDKIDYIAFIQNKDKTKQTTGNPNLISYISHEFSISGTSDSNKPVKIDCGNNTTVDLTFTIKSRDEVHRP